MHTDVRTIDRRNALKGILGGAIAAGFAFTVLPSAVEAAPLALEKSLPAAPLVTKAQGWGPPPPRHRRRRRRWVCWWRRGRRICGWRWGW